MGKEQEIIEGLKRLCGAPIQVVVAIVVSIDMAKLTMTCKPVDGGALYEDVRIKAAEDGNRTGLIEIPAVNSSVLLGLVENDKDTLVLLKCSVVSKILGQVGEYTFEMLNEDNAFLFNNGGNGGLVKVQELVQKLNAIEQKLSDFIVAFNAHTHTETGANTTGSNLNVGVFNQTTARADIENQFVKH